MIADPLAMLLSNLTKDAGCSAALLQLSPDSLALLADIFTRGEGKHANPNASFDFLASVLANVSITAAGRAALLKPDAPDRPTESPIAKLAGFTEHPSLIRRGGVISALKFVDGPAFPADDAETAASRTRRSTTCSTRNAPTSCLEYCCRSAGPRRLTPTCVC